MESGREVVGGHGGVMCCELPHVMQPGLVVHVFVSKQRQKYLLALIDSSALSDNWSWFLFKGRF